jgi:U3 small nucleolar RNA-associated protein 10
MVSSLATQLAQNASLNSSLLLEKTRRAPTESYLFTGRDADQHDLESTHALGRNGFLQLVSLKPSLRVYEQHLFSDSIKDLDRTLINKEQNKELDIKIAGFLREIGPYLLEGPAGKVLEWLVRRFRINEFNLEDVLALFLPYHESPHFAKMVTILHIPENSTWSFLRPFKSAAQSLPRVPLVTEMLKNTDVARFVAKLVPESIKKGYCHRTLLAFNAACLHDFMLRSARLDEGTMTFILAALLEPLQQHNDKALWLKDAILGSYILLCAFSQKCTLRPAAVEHIILAMTKCARSVSPTQYLNAAIAVCEPQEQVGIFSQAVLSTVVDLTNIGQHLCDVVIYEGFEKFAVPLLAAGLSR